VRILAATHRDLEAEVAGGTFRADLYFRLNVVRIRIPPLRERKADILPLFRFFVDKFNGQFNRAFTRIAPEAETRLLAYPWPGNTREIRNTAERIVLLEKGDTILPAHLASLRQKTDDHEATGRPAGLLPQGITLDEMEKSYILEALKIKKGNKVQAARSLGITRSALLYRMEKYGIKTPRGSG
ncbi:MAG: helix-turn-helix domain-containing protein, partial [Thermodesulfobacteriota bacterium]